MPEDRWALREERFPERDADSGGGGGFGPNLLRSAILQRTDIESLERGRRRSS
jgi:hypothetical protein